MTNPMSKISGEDPHRSHAHFTADVRGHFFALGVGLSSMARPKLLWIASIVIAAVAAALLAFRYGVTSEQGEMNRSLASVQATLAFGHLKSYERIESLLVRKCYGAALTEATGLKNLQTALVSENLRASGNAPELVEYIKTRDPKLLETVLAGPVPQPKPYTTTCP